MNKLELIQKIKQLDGLSQDEKAYLLNLVNTKKKYGLVWEDKPEDVEELLRTHLPVLREVPEKRILAKPQQAPKTPAKTTAPLLFDEQPEEINTTGENQSAESTAQAPNHILIEGDNLHALTALTFTHEGKIDVIYIDPPYNTGNKDFKYNDQFVDKEDSYRHSKWLSFMHKRLLIAKKLLKEEGIIFISIDENECYQLKLLCDEVFGDKNFIADHIWKSKSGGAGDASFIATDTENILAYAKNKLKLEIQNDSEATITTSYNKTESDGRRFSLDRLDKQSLGYQETLDFPITGPDGVVYTVEHKDPENKVARWRWGQKTVTDRYDELVFENGYVYTKNYEKDSAKPRNLLVEERFGRTRTGKTELYSIIGANDFSAPKPSRLIAYLIKLISSNNSIILDFFAGSGTTLQAIMQLNSIDDGGRIGILCTNNENYICDNVTYPRIFNVINGYESKGNSQVELFEENLTLTKLKKADKILHQVNGVKKENEARYSNIKVEVIDNSIIVWGECKKGELNTGLTNNNLRYYKSEFVSREPSLKNKKELTRLSTELLCIKEDCYHECTSAFSESAPGILKVFENQQGRFLCVIYDDNNIDEGVEILKKIIAGGHALEGIKVYVFSNGQYPYTEDFEEVLEHITLCALPDAIYKAYMNVLPKKQREFIPELEEPAAEEGLEILDESEGDL